MNIGACDGEDWEFVPMFDPSGIELEVVPVINECRVRVLVSGPVAKTLEMVTMHMVLNSG